jgi:hypothetical protein
VAQTVERIEIFGEDAQRARWEALHELRILVGQFGQRLVLGLFSGTLHCFSPDADIDSRHNSHFNPRFDSRFSSRIYVYLSSDSSFVSRAFAPLPF